jgi:hypothetical protein
MKLSTRFLALPLLVFGLLLSGCDSNGGNDELPVSGTWERVENKTSYLEITSDTFTEHYYQGNGCYDEEFSEIVERDGNTYTLDKRGREDTFTVTMTVEGDVLTVNTDSGIFAESSVDFEESSVSEFKLCN